MAPKTDPNKGKDKNIQNKEKSKAEKLKAEKPKQEKQKSVVKNKVPINFIAKEFKYLKPIEGNMEYSLEVMFQNEPLKVILPSCKSISINPYGNFCNFTPNDKFEIMYSTTVYADNLDSINLLSTYPLFVRLHIRQIALCPPGEVMCINPIPSYECINYPKPPPAQCCVPPPKVPKKRKQTTVFMDVEGEGEIEVEVDETDSEEEIEEIAEEYTFEENYHCIAQGHYDLLKYIDYNAINDTVSIVLHSVLDPEEDPDQEPVELVMNIQTLISILNSKEFPLTNAAFITIETIFNIPPSWLEQDLKFEVKFEILPVPGIFPEPIGLCTFSTKLTTTYEFNDFVQKWAKLVDKSDLTRNTGLTTGRILKSTFDDLFIGNYKIDSSQFNGDTNVLIFNALNRFIFGKKECLLFENIIGIMENQIQVTLSYEIESFIIKYIGLVDLSPLLYPDVTEGRFAIVLNLTLPTSDNPSKGKFSKSIKPPTKQMVAVDQLVADQTEPILIFEIAFKTPLTEAPDCKFNCVKLPILPTEPIFIPTKQFPLNELQAFSKYNFEIGIKKILSIIPSKLNDFNESNWLDLDCVSVLDKIPQFESIKEILNETIFGLISSKYNVQRPTETNLEFRELMADIYNVLIKIVDEVVDDYYSGGYDEVQSQEERNMRIFTALECVQLEFENISESILINLEEKANTTEEYFEVAIYSVVNFDMEKTLRILTTILSKNPNHYYCFLLKTYIEYKNGVEDIYLEAIAELTKKFPNAIEPWVLLYCFYTEHNYRAGYQYAKMKIDQIFEVPAKLPSFIMTKDVYLDTIDFKDSPFCYTLLVLLKMGLFDFCEIVFNYCKNDLSYEEQQTIFWPLLLYQGKINKLEQVLNSTPVDPRSELYVTKRAFYGHAKYFVNKKSAAINEYELIFNSKDYSEINKYEHIAFLRCGFWYLDKKEYETARTYFTTCCKISKSFLSFYGAGICYYELNCLKDAEIAFSNSTKFRLEFSDLWMYLALINLKLNKTKKATECYLTAKRAGHIKEELDFNYNELLKKNMLKNNLSKIALKN